MGVQTCVFPISPLQLSRWYPDVATTSDLIAEEKALGRYVIVYAHWGEEYSSTSSEQVRAAHAFIESGADAVIGSHPHVVQDLEYYLGKPIFYSLGNFIFDQWFSPEVMRGMGVRVVFNPPQNPQFQVIDFEINRDGTTCPVSDEI